MCCQLLGRCDNSFFTPDEKFFDTSPISAAVYLYDGVAAIALAAQDVLLAVANLYETLALLRQWRAPLHAL